MFVSPWFLNVIFVTTQASGRQLAFCTCPSHWFEWKRMTWKRETVSFRLLCHVFMCASRGQEIHHRWGNYQKEEWMIEWKCVKEGRSFSRDLFYRESLSRSSPHSISLNPSFMPLLRLAMLMSFRREKRDKNLLPSSSSSSWINYFVVSFISRQFTPLTLHTRHSQFPPPPSASSSFHPARFSPMVSKRGRCVVGEESMFSCESFLNLDEEKQELILCVVTQKGNRENPPRFVNRIFRTVWQVCRCGSTLSPQKLLTVIIME